MYFTIIEPHSLQRTPVTTVHLPLVRKSSTLWVPLENTLQKFNQLNKLSVDNIHLSSDFTNHDNAFCLWVISEPL
jgi:hypothetical protein